MPLLTGTTDQAEINREATSALTSCRNLSFPIPLAIANHACPHCALSCNPDFTLSPFSIFQTRRRGPTFCVPSSAASGSAAVAAALGAGTGARTRILPAAAAAAAAARPLAGAEGAGAVPAATAGPRGPTLPTLPESSRAWERTCPSPAAWGSRPHRRAERNLYYRRVRCVHSDSFSKLFIVYLGSKAKRIARLGGG